MSSSQKGSPAAAVPVVTAALHEEPSAIVECIEPKAHTASSANEDNIIAVRGLRWLVG
jgi:hypothetical protein